MSSREVWHFEKVSIKDTEYAQKCGLKGDCYFWVSKGLIKIEQLDRKTSFQITVSHIRNWGASSKVFFLELGTRSPTGHGRLEMNTKDPNSLRLLVRDTTSSSKRKELPLNQSSDTSDVYLSDYEQDSGYGASEYPHRKKDTASPSSTSGYVSGYGNSKDPEYDDDVTVPTLPIHDTQKWYKKKTTSSEESKGAIPVGKTSDGTHVKAGDGDDLYRMPRKKSS